MTRQVSVTQEYEYSNGCILVKPSENLLFEPEKWNAPEIVRHKNCFAYALNSYEVGFKFWSSVFYQDSNNINDLRSAWEGACLYSQHKKTKFAEPVLKCAKLAGLRPVSYDFAHASQAIGRHIIAYSPKWEHFYRRDSDGSWSQKMGIDPIENKTRNGEPIFDLAKPNFPWCHEVSFSHDQRMLYFEVPKSGIWIRKF